MRDKKTQDFLDAMDNADKLEKTSRLNFEDRWSLVMYDPDICYYLTINEYPHQNRWPNQYVLWSENCYEDINDIALASKSLFNYAIEKFGHMNITFHPPRYKSIEMRPHLHIYDDIK